MLLMKMEHMKTLQIKLTESEWKQLVNIKGKMSWREFLLKIVAKK